MASARNLKRANSIAGRTEKHSCAQRMTGHIPQKSTQKALGSRWMNGKEIDGEKRAKRERKAVVVANREPRTIPQ